jgi:hypothetical protein
MALASNQYRWVRPPPGFGPSGNSTSCFRNCSHDEEIYGRSEIEGADDAEGDLDFVSEPHRDGPPIVLEGRDDVVLPRPAPRYDRECRQHPRAHGPASAPGGGRRAGRVGTWSSLPRSLRQGPEETPSCRAQLVDAKLDGSLDGHDPADTVDRGRVGWCREPAVGSGPDVLVETRLDAARLFQLRGKSGLVGRRPAAHPVGAWPSARLGPDRRNRTFLGSGATVDPDQITRFRQKPFQLLRQQVSLVRTRRRALEAPPTTAGGQQKTTGQDGEPRASSRSRDQERASVLADPGRRGLTGPPARACRRRTLAHHGPQRARPGTARPRPGDASAGASGRSTGSRPR